MTALIFFGLSLALFAAFLVLTHIEARRGARVFAQVRTQLDQKVGKVLFVIDHVDLQGAIRDLLRDGITRAIHDIAHGSLVAVRFIERLLTQAVRALRRKRAEAEAQHTLATPPASQEESS